VAEAYADVAPRFWIGQLQYANEFEGTANPKGNQDGFRSGQQILDGVGLTHPSGAPYLYMGCNGGLRGSLTKMYLEDDAWQEHLFQVRRERYPHRNWFTIADFRDTVKG
jgi:hypothetical protein